MKKVLVTGGAGFIGSNFVRVVLNERPGWQVTVLDKLTYAGRLENLADLQDNPRFSFIKGDICDSATVAEAVKGCDIVFNFAAETHVDRSLMAGDAHAGAFIQTDVHGVYILLEEVKRQGTSLFVQVSTDEVYGDIPEGYSVESDPLSPRSPYSASKAGGELIASSYFISHGTPVIITRGSNTFGPHQYPEKMLPLFISNALDDQSVPIYGDGLQRRDWLFVEDHARGILTAAEEGKVGEAYNVGGGNERTNKEVTELVLSLLDKPLSLIQRVSDRPGHDRRYALNCTKLQGLGWKPRQDFEAALASTVDWYRANEEWWRALKSEADYQEYYRRNYKERTA